MNSENYNQVGDRLTFSLAAHNTGFDSHWENVTVTDKVTNCAGWSIQIAFGVKAVLMGKSSKCQQVLIIAKITY